MFQISSCDCSCHRLCCLSENVYLNFQQPSRLKHAAPVFDMLSIPAFSGRTWEPQESFPENGKRQSCTHFISTRPAALEPGSTTISLPGWCAQLTGFQSSVEHNQCIRQTIPEVAGTARAQSSHTMARGNKLSGSSTAVSRGQIQEQVVPSAVGIINHKVTFSSLEQNLLKHET